jgi:D-glycero-D-manno-heptose 1,7-bisphosphate phosphatase
MKRAVFLDRDGVLNEPVVRDSRPYPPPNIDGLKLYPEALIALSDLKRAGFLLIVVTNQPDVARATQTRETVNAINAAIGAVLPVDDFRICWHDDADECHCRKPKPGLILEAAVEYGVDLRKSFLIGDRWRDVEAGAAAGCRTILIDRRYQEKSARDAPDFIANSLIDAVDWIIAKETVTIRQSTS